MLLTAPALDRANPSTDLMHLLVSASPQTRCLLVIDAARYDERAVLRQVYALDENPNWFWLFEGTPFEEHKEAGPMVVEVAVGDAFFDYAVSQWGGDEALAILVSQHEQELALLGIRKSLMLHLETHGPCFVRSYDARFLEVLSLCLPIELGGLVSAGDTLLWAVTQGNQVYWSGVKGTKSEIRGLHAHQQKSFERLLSWVASWSRCMAIADQSQQAPHQRTETVRTLWLADMACPESNAELGALWQSAVQGHNAIHEKDFDNVGS